MPCCFGHFERDGGTCDDVECSGHGRCVESDAGDAVCECDAGWVTAGADCVADEPDADVEPDGDVEPDAPPTCPEGMVDLPTLGACIDQYEASIGSSLEAASAASVAPWASIGWAEASAACAASGKRLCSEAEWLDACRGPARGEYPYGASYDPTACNGVERGILAAMNTGFNGRCEGGYPGLFDMSGNLQEWTASCSGDACSARGGGFGDDALALRCGSGALVARGTSQPDLGFRCCVAR
jgi:hypothetical protein